MRHMKTILMLQSALLQSKEGAVTTVVLLAPHSRALPGDGYPVAQPLKPPSVGFAMLLW
jgi:hypothetical protein